MKILHLSFDIPDEFKRDKTVAIKNLIDASTAAGNENFYISMNRTNQILSGSKIIEDKKYLTIRKFGFPYGIGLLKMLRAFYNDIIINKKDLDRFDIIHAHKLTYEGYIAYLLNVKFNIPYCVSIRATDFKVIKFRRDLKRKYKKIILNSEKIFCISYWMVDELRKTFGEETISEIESKITILPNIIDKKEYKFNTLTNNKYVTIFKITKGNIKRKNIKRTLLALKYLEDGTTLDIIGDGSGYKDLEKFIQNNGLEDRVNLKGKMNNSKILEILGEYKCLIMCSLQETFGLVYVEALINGVPIIYNKGTGIDGFFDNIGKAVNGKSIKSIRESIEDMNCNFKEYKKNVKALQEDGKLLIFTKEKVSQLYKKNLDDISKLGGRE